MNAERPLGSRPRSLSRIAVLAWSVLVLNLMVVLFGAYVRATHSGDGCGGHWPTCHGQIVPQDLHGTTLVEYGHRLSSGVALVMVAVLFVAARRGAVRRVRLAAAAAAGIMLLEAALGAMLVVFGWVAHDTSVARAVVMPVHLLNTMLLLGSLALTAWWSSGFPALDLRGGRRHLPLVTLVLVGLLLVGVSGAWTALSDTLYPAASFFAGGEAELAGGAPGLLRLRAVHPFLALCVGLLVTGLALGRGRANKNGPAPVLGIVVAAAFMAQVLVGLTNVALLTPPWLQLVHLLLAELLWLATLLLAATLLAKGAGAGAEDARAAPSLHGATGHA